MKKFDDSDIKIFGNQKKSDDFDPMLLLEEIKRQRGSGNTAKAKTVAKHIAAGFMHNAAPDELKQLAAQYGVELSPVINHQIKVLSVFSAEYALNEFLPSPLLSSVAINELYESILDESPDFYEQLESGTAFTFYYLAVRSGGNRDKEIGSAFASQCGKEKDKALTALGTAIHKNNIEAYRSLISGFNFES